MRNFHKKHKLQLIREINLYLFTEYSTDIISTKLKDKRSITPKFCDFKSLQKQEFCENWKYPFYLLNFSNAVANVANFQGFFLECWNTCVCNKKSVIVVQLSCYFVQLWNRWNGKYCKHFLLKFVELSRNP